MTRKSTIYLAVVAMLAGGFSYSCLAQSKSKNKSYNSNSYPAKQKAVRHVKNQTGGRVLDVKQQSSGNNNVWRVKFLKDGKIQYMDVAPQSAND